MKGVVGMTENTNNFYGEYGRYEKDAEKVIEAGETETVLGKALKIIAKVPVLKSLATDVPVMVNMVKDYIRKKYKRVPLKTITMITAALIYLVNPNDAVPDYLPGVGYLDDAAVMNFVLMSVKEDVEKYKEWKCAAWS